MAAHGDEVKLHMLPRDEKADINNQSGLDDGGVDGDNGDADGQTEGKTANVPKVRNLFFNDGQRRIDFILAWSTEIDKQSENAKTARRVFEANLEGEGLHLEYERKEGGKVHFVKIHAPYDVIKRYADILKLRVPMKEIFTDQHSGDSENDWEGAGFNITARAWHSIVKMIRKILVPFHYDEVKLPPIKRTYTCPYAASREYLFEIPENRDELFRNSTRSWIVDYTLRRKPFSEQTENTFSFGIKKMLNDGYYTAAYPLHEGHWKAGSAENPRKILYDHWASWRNCLKFQPIDYIRFYYGEKISLYFAWLGFYTSMLLPATVVGIAVFIYGLAVMYTSTPSKELCDPRNNITMCPLCDTWCPYWKLSDACSHARAGRICDNGATVFFAIFMSLWGTLFLEFWKRKQATIQYKWDLTQFVEEEEPPRPEFLSKLQNWETMKTNPITGKPEPYLPFWRKRFPVYLTSFSIMLLLAAVAVIAVIGVIVYRVSMMAALQIIPGQIKTNSTVLAATAGLIYENASLFTTVTAALINLAIIIVLNIVYDFLAFKLTDWECLRTQSEYDSSITIKLFTLQFVNYFSSIFYIAFFKGQFLGRPGKYRKIFGGRQEECEAGGCLIELSLQLAIIFVGKQLIQNNILEIFLPKVLKFIKSKLAKEKKNLASTPWEKDYLLQPAQTISLFYEYLEMVLQFGFLTIFCSAFPLAPLFALINNIVEIRVDASKFTRQLRRPVAEKAATIGIWYSVLYGISRIAIITNAFIIAVTSEFIPRLVYSLRYSADESLAGYVNFTLAYFNTSDFPPESMPKDLSLGRVEICRYKDFRNPPWIDPEYRRSSEFWHILAARLAFVCIFENVVVVFTSLLSWLIPDVPTILKEQIRREAYVTNEIVLATELKRARGEVVIEDVARINTEDNIHYSPHHSESPSEELFISQRKPFYSSVAV